MKSTFLSRSLKTLAAVCFCTGAFAQEFDFEQIKREVRAIHPHENLLVYKSVNAYGFQKSENAGTPVEGKLTSENLLVNVFNQGSVQLYEGSNSFSNIDKTSAWMYDPDKDRFSFISSTPLKHHYESNGIFHNDFYVNEITTAGRDAGLYRITYDKSYSDYKFLAVIPFVGNAPTVNQEVQLTVPAWLEVEVVEQNFGDFHIASKVSTSEDGATVYHYVWENIPALREDGYAPSVRHFLPHLILVYKHFDDAGTQTPLMPDVGGLYGWYHSLVREVEEDPAAIADLVDQFRELPKGKAQIDAVYVWVRDNIRYIAFEAGLAGFKPESCQNVYNNRYGDCKGMANLCKNILAELGYDARLAWIGTRGEVPYTYDIPSLAVDNHMIAAVITDGDTLYLDPTESYGRSGEYAYRIHGRPVLIENGDSFVVAKVPESHPEADRVLRSYKVKFHPEAGVAAFDATSSYRGEPKKQILGGLNNLLSNNREEALINYLRINATGSFNLIETTGLEEVGEQIDITYQFTTQEGVIDLGGEYFIDIDPSFDLEHAALYENRVAPWYFDERYNRHTQIEFEVPQGYRVQHTPEAFTCKSKDFAVTVGVVNEKNRVTIDKNIQVPQGMIDVANRRDWESCLARLKAYYQDRVIILNENHHE